MAKLLFATVRAVLFELLEDPRYLVLVRKANLSLRIPIATRVFAGFCRHEDEPEV